MLFDFPEDVTDAIRQVSGRNPYRSGDMQKAVNETRREMAGAAVELMRLHGITALEAVSYLVAKKAHRSHFLPVGNEGWQFRTFAEGALREAEEYVRTLKNLVAAAPK